jgi:hypothetical protein
MATAYYTDAYNNNVPPDKNVPAGVVLSQFTTFVGVTGNHGSGDTFYFFRIPKNAVLLDLTFQWPAISTGTVSIGTSDGAATIVSGAAVTGAGRFSLTGGFQGSTAITSTLVQTVTVGTKFTSADYIYATFATAYPAADDVLRMSISYFIDYGADMAYDPG